MVRHPKKPSNLLKLPLAALLVVTLSGAYYLFCCQEVYASPTTAQHAAVESGQSGHCKFFQNKSSESSTEATGLNAFETCALKFKFYVAKLEKKQFPQNTPVLAHNFFNFLEPVKLDHASGFTGFRYRPPVFAAGDLNIKNCVFRI